MPRREIRGTCRSLLVSVPRISVHQLSTAPQLPRTGSASCSSFTAVSLQNQTKLPRCEPIRQRFQVTALWHSAPPADLPSIRLHPMNHDLHRCHLPPVATQPRNETKPNQTPDRPHPIFSLSLFSQIMIFPPGANTVDLPELSRRIPRPRGKNRPRGKTNRQWPLWRCRSWEVSLVFVSLHRCRDTGLRILRTHATCNNIYRAKMLGTPHGLKQVRRNEVKPSHTLRTSARLATRVPTLRM